MKAAKLPELANTLDRWRDDQAGLSDVAYLLGWPLNRTAEIFRDVGIITVGGELTEGLMNQEIINALLWYYVNVLLARSSTRPVK